MSTKLSHYQFEVYKYTSIFKFQETEQIYFWKECTSNIISLSQGQDSRWSELPRLSTFLLIFGTAIFSGTLGVKTDHTDH
jgi:hypothetical protein